MFTIDTNITDLKVRERNITKILFSMNIHQVATPEMMLENARTYVLFFRETRGKYAAYIALHLLTTDRRLYYSYSSNPFTDDQLDAVEEEALAFAESLGAMIDEVDFNNMPEAAQDSWLDEHDIFSKKPKTVPQPTAAPLPPQLPPQQPAAPETQQVILPPSQPTAAPLPPQQPAAPAPQPVMPPAQPIAAPIQPQPQPQTLSMPETPQPIQAKPQQKSTAKRHQEIMQQAIKTSIAKTAKKTAAMETQPIAGVVSRDREALARLLASF